MHRLSKSLSLSRPSAPSSMGRRRSRCAWVAACACLVLAASAAPPAAAATPEGGDDPPASDAADADPEAPPEAPVATAARDLDAAIRVIQPRPVLKDSRLELQLGAGLVASDTMFDHYFATGSLRFHISEWVSVAGTYAHYFSRRSELFERVTEDFELYPEISRVDFYAGADVSVMPIDGKFVLFDSAIVYFEIYALIGGGVTKTSRSDSVLPTGVVGAGLRLFLADWLTFNVEVRDHIFFEEFDAGTELVNNVTGLASFSILMPFGFDYTYPR